MISGNALQVTGLVLSLAAALAAGYFGIRRRALQRFAPLGLLCSLVFGYFAYRLKSIPLLLVAAVLLIIFLTLPISRPRADG